jgi:hypothetical protein
MVLLTSCGSENSIVQSSENSRSIDKSKFTGDHASEIYNLYKNTTNQAASKLLSDGDFSEQDMVDIENMYVVCMKTQGYEVTFDRNPNYPDTESVKAPEDIPDDIKLKNKQSEQISASQMRCYKETDLFNLQLVYNAIHYPNLGKVTITDEERISCLKAKNLVPETYTTDEYKYDSGDVDGKRHGEVQKYLDSTSSSNTHDSQTFLNCINNPKG